MMCPMMLPVVIIVVAVRAIMVGMVARWTGVDHPN